MRLTGVERADRLGVLEASAGFRRFESARHASFHQSEVVGEMLVYAAAGGLPDFFKCFLFFTLFLTRPSSLRRSLWRLQVRVRVRACCVCVCVNFIQIEWMFICKKMAGAASAEPPARAMPDRYS
jgi:hypothetical protein